MSDISLTSDQSNAVKKAAEWFRNCRSEIDSGKKLTQQIFRIFGFAGCGKSTITKYIMGEIGGTTMPRITAKTREERLDARDEIREMAAKNPLVLYGAFTGKAALVMTRKGTPASTIHSMLYTPQEASPEAIKEAKAALASLRKNGPGTDDPHLWQAMIRDRENQLKNMHKPTFILNHDSMVRDAALVVLDEVSMVGEEMGLDLMSFGRPIMVLGDPGQLPPIKGEGIFTQAEPDVMLTEIMRQAAESPIIQLATMAREGKFIPFGRYSESVLKMPRSQVGIVYYLGAGQVLCGYNATRIGLNNQMKVAAGFPGDIPVGSGEKIICLKNRHADGLINGQFLTLTNIGDQHELGFMADILTEDGNEVGRHTVYKGHFEDHVAVDKERDHRDYFKKKGMVECVWGYAITGHKSQGSQWENVIVYDDGFGRGPDRARWLYTVITRAENGLLILA